MFYSGHKKEDTKNSRRLVDANRGAPSFHQRVVPPHLPLPALRGECHGCIVVGFRHSGGRSLRGKNERLLEKRSGTA
jgi:hypothetical protein